MNFPAYFPLLIPVILLQVGFAIFALVHVLRHPKYRVGNRVLWVVLVLCVQWIGPILYFTIGRGEEE